MYYLWRKGETSHKSCFHRDKKEKEMTNRCFLTTYHNYNYPYSYEYHKPIYDYFVDHVDMWKDLVDTIYIIDSHWNFTEEEKKRLQDKIPAVFLPIEIEGHFNVQLPYFLPQIKEEEILFMDNDCFIYERFGVSRWFDLLKYKTAVLSYMEPGSGDNIAHALWKKYPFMKENNARSFWPNHFAIRKSFWGDNFTIESYKEQAPFPTGTYIPELDYTTVVGDYGEYWLQWVLDLLKDGAWTSMPVYPNQGFYHRHGFTWAYMLLQKKKDNDPEYWSFIKQQPIEKYLPILNLYQIIDEKGRFREEMQEIIFDLLKFNTKEQL